MNKPKITYKCFPKEGFIEFIIDDKLICERTYDGDEESAVHIVNDLKKVFNLGFNYRNEEQKGE